MFSYFLSLEIIVVLKDFHSKSEQYLLNVSIGRITVLNIDRLFSQNLTNVLLLTLIVNILIGYYHNMNVIFQLDDFWEQKNF